MYGNFYEAVRVIMEGKISLNEKKRSFWSHFYTKNRSFRQDRLVTDIYQAKIDTNEGV